MMPSTCNPLMKTPTFKNLEIATRNPIHVKTIEVIAITRERVSANAICPSDGLFAVVTLIDLVDGGTELVWRILSVSLPSVAARMKSGMLNLLGPKKNFSGDRP
jgi:hypothetical protein